MVRVEGGEGVCVRVRAQTKQVDIEKKKEVVTDAECEGTCCVQVKPKSRVV